MSIATILSIAGLVLGSNWLGNLITEIYKNRKQKKTPAEQMILAIGRDRLLFLSKKYIRDGSIPEDEFEAFEKMGTAYVAMGGNSLVKKRLETALKLPVVEGDEQNERCINQAAES